MTQYPSGYDTSAANHMTVRPSNWEEVEGDSSKPATELLEDMESFEWGDEYNR